MNKRFNLLLNPLRIHKDKFMLTNINLTKNLNKHFCEKQPSNIKDKYTGVLFTEHTDHLHELNLNMPSKYNSLDIKMIRAMLRRVRQWVPYNIDGFSSDDGESQGSTYPKVALFSGTGKAFCAGGDIVDIYKAKVDKDFPNPKLLKDFFRYEYLLDYSLTTMNPIQIALWHGAIMGGGVGLSINSPFKICTDSAIFAMPETKIGLFTDVGASYFLPRLLNNSPELGLYLGLTGEHIKGKQLAITGVATHYVKLENFAKIKDILIKGVNEASTNKTISKLLSDNVDYTYDQNRFDFPFKEEIEIVFKLDSLDGIFNRLKEYSTNSNVNKAKWAQNTLNTLNSHSPLSLTIVLEQLKRGVEMSTIEEAFNMEAQLVASFMEDSDFFEGVRALLIDKDNKPKWKHASYKEVDLEAVRKFYFDRNEEIDVDPNN